MRVTLVVPDRAGLPRSGGDRYDAALAARWRQEGEQVDVLAARGGWPRPTQDRVAELGRRLDAIGDEPVLVDGLVGCAAPEVVERSARERPTAVLVHALLADGAGVHGEEAEELDRRERRALHAAGAVVTTSRWAADRLAGRHALADVHVAPPGTARAAVAPGSLAGGGPPLLLALGAVTPLKNQGLLLAALEPLLDLPWALVVAGEAPDPGHLAGLREDAAARGLAGRVAWSGDLEDGRLEELWSRTDLLVHPSRSETFGMVVAEAHAHGVPTVVGAGTGAVEALAGPGGGGGEDLPGTAVATDDPGPLEEVLRRWLTGADLRDRWRAAALDRRPRLVGWEVAAARIRAALGRIAP